jgi:hypothetical protein
MALKFGTVPEATRFGATAGPAPISEEDQAEFIDNPGNAACVAEDVDNAQKFTNWAVKMNGKDENGNNAEGPWFVGTRAHILKTGANKGSQHTQEVTLTKGANKGNKGTKRYVDVWMEYNPEGRPAWMRKRNA